jgi:hypothetical protein
MTDLPQSIRFNIAELNDELPGEGYHPAVIATARLRMSQNNNPTLQVTYELQDAASGCETVAEYFVLLGSSARARAVSLRRLLALYRACGFEPHQGDPIRPEDLVSSRVEVRIGHETYDGMLRLRVLGYRAVS